MRAKLCSFYYTSGCTNKSCTFLHDEDLLSAINEDLKTNKKNNKKKRVCSHCIANTCTHGESCRFYHPESVKAFYAQSNTEPGTPLSNRPSPARSAASTSCNRTFTPFESRRPQTCIRREERTPTTRQRGGAPASGLTSPSAIRHSPEDAELELPRTNTFSVVDPISQRVLASHQRPDTLGETIDGLLEDRHEQLVILYQRWGELSVYDLRPKPRGTALLQFFRSKTKDNRCQEIIALLELDDVEPVVISNVDDIKPALCLFFLTGSCSKGDECTFHHDEEARARVQTDMHMAKTKRKRICAFALSKSCQHGLLGSDCTFFHSQSLIRPDADLPFLAALQQAELTDEQEAILDDEGIDDLITLRDVVADPSTRAGLRAAGLPAGALNRLKKQLRPAPTPAPIRGRAPAKRRSGTPCLKTPAQRQRDRESAGAEGRGLPILKAKKDFQRRLLAEKVLVVTAETGSGKTTQLPQYSAEVIDDGIVVCTQPRQLAALSLAKRIAEEFDGVEPGHNVGFLGGRGKRINGDQIMLMTDAAFVVKSGDPHWMARVKVLIIDEAHERNLETDLTLGVAKLALEARQDFHVVVASATIDPAKFNAFFGCREGSEMRVEGRTYPVDLITQTVDTKDARTAQQMVRYAVPEIHEILAEHDDGNALVFMPGAKEIETSIEQLTERLTPDQRDSWHIYPLHGKVTPEQQDQVIGYTETPGERMVVFCTNIAETSLTIPRTTIVIDLGRAKEARYDAVRRVNILEELYISRSSADQRKGRAGRTESGTCIRLYEDDCIERESVVPQIQRSSLEAVILRLLDLGHSIHTFPLIDRPSKEAIAVSLDVLETLGCIKAGSITPKGQLFLQLDTGPMEANFAWVMAERGFSQAGAELAAIMTTDSLFFTGGQTKAEKDRAVATVADSASGYQSDLLHELAVYRTWAMHHNPSCSGGGRCKCKVLYARDHHLNNKSLKSVEQISRQMLKVFPRAMQSSGAAVPDENIIAEMLVRCFWGQIGEYVDPGNPNSDIYLLSSAVSGQCERTSCMIHVPPARLRHTKQLVAMGVIQLPSGVHLLSRMHLVDLQHLPASQRVKVEQLQRHFTSCYAAKNVGAVFLHHLRKTFQKPDKPDFLELASVKYDQDTTRLDVTGPRAHKTQIKNYCRAVINAKYRELIEYTHSQPVGSDAATAIFSAGFKLEDVTRDSLVVLAMPPSTVTDKKDRTEAIEAAEEWLLSGAKISSALVSYSGFVKGTQNKVFKASFVDTAAAEQARRFISEQPGVSADSSISNALAEENHGCTIQWNHPRFNLSNIDDVFSRSGLDAVSQTATNRVSINIQNLAPAPAGYGDLGGPTVKYTGHTEPKNGRGSGTFKFTVNSLGALHKFMSASATFPWSEEQFRYISVWSQGIKFPSVAKAKAFMDSVRANEFGATEVCSSLVLPHPEVYPEVATIAGSIQAKYGVTVRVGKTVTNDRGSRCYIDIKHPTEASKVASACQAFRTYSSPTFTRFFTHRDRAMIQHARDADLVAQWEATHRVFTEINADATGQRRGGAAITMRVFGSGSARGAFMRALGDFSAGLFTEHYRSLRLSTNMLYQFSRRTSKGRLLLESHKADGTLTDTDFNFATNTIAVYRKAGGGVDRRFLDRMIATLSGKRSSHVPRCCSYCHKDEADQTFFICGHPYCATCLAEDIARGTNPLCCPQCHCLLSVKECLRAASDTDSVNAMVSDHLATAGKAIAVCPNAGCSAIIDKTDGYHACWACHENVCGICRAVNKPGHTDRNCLEFIDAYRASSAFDVEALVSEGRRYLDIHWDPQLGDAHHVQVNPALHNGSEAMQLYCRGILKTQPSVTDEAGARVWAWHGSMEDAYRPICDGGFDTKRRSGQAYGAGEYFGVTASMSNGYNRQGGNNRRMLLCVIINLPNMVKKERDFCYVVNNPLDNSYHICLPVLLVTFSQTGPYVFTSRTPKELPFPKRNDAVTPFTVQPIDRQYLLGKRQCTLDSANTAWRLPYKWSWMGDENEFLDYPDKQNYQIQAGHAAWKKDGPGRITLTPLKRLSDDVDELYMVDFEMMQQINGRTNYTRQVRQHANTAVVGDEAWMYEDDKGALQPFDSSAQSGLDRKFKHFIENGMADAVSTITFAGRPETYEVNFQTGKQRNLQSGTVRNIQRVSRQLTKGLKEKTYHISLGRHQPTHSFTAHLPDLIRDLSRRLDTAHGMELERPVSIEATERWGQHSLAVTFNGPAISLAPAVLGFLHQEIWRLCRVTPVMPEVASDNLMRLSSSRFTEPNNGTRSWAMLMISHTIVHKARLGIYGGFCRDWVVRGQEANDIDVNVPQGGDAAGTARVVANYIQTKLPGVWIHGPVGKGAAQCITIQHSTAAWADIQVDFCEDDLTTKTYPYVDCDIDNMIIDHEGLHKRREAAGGSMIPLTKCVSHCIKGKFVFFYSTTDPRVREMVGRRLTKLIQTHRFTCINRINRDLVKERGLPAKLIQPNAKYNLQWWAM